MCRSQSRDTYLSVPGSKRERGTSLTEDSRSNSSGGGGGGGHEADLYRLRKFTVSNKKIISHTESFHLRQHRSSNTSINSSASRYSLNISDKNTHVYSKFVYLFSLTVSYSGKSSFLQSSTEEDFSESSRNSSLATLRYTVLMLGDAEVGKTTLTSQFMSGSNASVYYQDSIGEEHTILITMTFLSRATAG